LNLVRPSGSRGVDGAAPQNPELAAEREEEEAELAEGGSPS
jgi:hypothetical protein